MATRILHLSVLVAVAFCATAVIAQEPADKGTLATQIAEGRKQNQMMMREYSWNMRTELKIDGEVKSLKVDMMRYTPEGELQKTKISDSADGQKQPRGIKGKAATRIKSNKASAASLSSAQEKLALLSSSSL